MNQRVWLGQRIRQLRTVRRMSQGVLAERMGVSWKYLSSVECGKENPTLDLLMKLAQHLGISLTELFASPSPLSRRELKEKIALILDAADDERLREILWLLKAPDL